MKSESEEDWQFILEHAQISFWERAPRVVVTDFSKGLKAALLAGRLSSAF
jgi:hypothetical protein